MLYITSLYLIHFIPSPSYLFISLPVSCSSPHHIPQTEPLVCSLWVGFCIIIFIHLIFQIPHISENICICILWLISLSIIHPPGPSMLLQHLLNGFKLQTRFVTSKNDKLINPESKFCFEKANKGVGKGRIRRQGSKLGAQSPFESLMCSDVLFWVLF